MKDDAMSLRECYAAGFDYGHNAASWTDMPAIGDTLPRHLDWIGIGTVETVEDQIEAWEMLVGEACDYGRSYSPFEFTAHAINLRDEAYGEGESEAGWDAFERGQHAAIQTYRRKHFPIRQLRRDAKEAA